MCFRRAAPRTTTVPSREARYVAQHVAAVSATRRKVRVEFKLPPSRDDAAKNGASHATKWYVSGPQYSSATLLSKCYFRRCIIVTRSRNEKREMSWRKRSKRLKGGPGGKQKHSLLVTRILDLSLRWHAIIFFSVALVSLLWAKI